MNNDDIERKRVELELSLELATEKHMSDSSKSRLIRKLLDLIEEELNAQD